MWTGDYQSDGTLNIILQQTAFSSPAGSQKPPKSDLLLTFGGLCCLDPDVLCGGLTLPAYLRLEGRNGLGTRE